MQVDQFGPESDPVEGTDLHPIFSSPTTSDGLNDLGEVAGEPGIGESLQCHWLFVWLGLVGTNAAPCAGGAPRERVGTTAGDSRAGPGVVEHGATGMGKNSNLGPRAGV